MTCKFKVSTFASTVCKNAAARIESSGPHRPWKIDLVKPSRDAQRLSAVIFQVDDVTCKVKILICASTARKYTVARKKSLNGLRL